MSEKLFIIIPAYNEEMNIEQVVREWHPIVERIGVTSKLIVIDDGSKDDTYLKLQELSEKYKQLEAMTKKNSGHGATVLFGYKYALDNEADFIFQTDSDGQTIASEFQQFWNLRNKYSAIIGKRNHREDGISRIFVTKVLKIVLLMVFKINVPDANTPFRLMKNNVLKKHISIVPIDYNLTNVLLTVSMIKAKEKICFIPITFRERQGGVNSINFRRIMSIGKQAIIDFKVIKQSKGL